jgi:hypothetical protein
VLNQKHRDEGPQLLAKGSRPLGEVRSLVGLGPIDAIAVMDHADVREAVEDDEIAERPAVARRPRQRPVVRIDPVREPDHGRDEATRDSYQDP